MKINQMKRDELFEGFYLIKGAELRKTRAGKNYLAMVFQDDTGEISGNLWDAQPHNVQEFTTGRVVHMTGRREVYNGSPQVNQITLRLPRDGEPNDPSLFREKSPVNLQETRDYLEQMLFKIENATWQRIVRALYRKYDQAFYHFPAAKTNHHAFESGLAYHTATMIRLAEALVTIYPVLNKSLLFAGIMIHDLAKVLELTGADHTEYTIRGNLIGHIALVNEEITKVVMELGLDDQSEEVLLLRHLVLSHHGQLEYGSPVRPMVMEAEILHQIDNIDAKMMMMMTALDKVDKGELTPRIFALDSRSFYKPHLDPIDKQ
ncbi:3'-5' exoribonuclease YhaM family protein [Streptococcus cuniculipharyngis]|uniref:HD domain-containing protein n=1 Tax=Streptococcus cuniculipharyngis TaxID=1562651 RepID=A0A5C5SDG6_9STRE|nr:HD domain-containing protein [Streptococcus cuniculipharyngis]TWS97726.1 HD domain-containing protein [Streptococcus cuniculipharyngis]